MLGLIHRPASPLFSVLLEQACALPAAGAVILNLLLGGTCFFGLSRLVFGGKQASSIMVTDEQLKERLRALLAESDLATTTEKKLRKRLEQEFGVELSDKKAIIRAEVEDFLKQQEPEEEEEVEEEEEGDEENGKGGGRGGGLGSLLSEEMQEFLGVERMARPKVVQALWEYIRANNLQDPSNKRNIILDDKLSKLFTPPMNMFSMNKQLSRHVKTKDAEAGEGASGSSRPRAKAPAAKRQKKEGGGGGGGGFMKACQLSPELAALVGQETMTRGDLTKWFWAYFKEHDLQDPQDKRFVLADETLQKLFNEERFLAFSVSKHISAHIVK